MTYRELQAKLREYRDRGLTEIRLNSSREELEAELERLTIQENEIAENITIVEFDPNTPMDECPYYLLGQYGDYKVEETAITADEDEIECTACDGSGFVPIQEEIEEVEEVAITQEEVDPVTKPSINEEIECPYCSGTKEIINYLGNRCNCFCCGGSGKIHPKVIKMIEENETFEGFNASYSNWVEKLEEQQAIPVFNNIDIIRPEEITNFLYRLTEAINQARSPPN